MQQLCIKSCDHKLLDCFFKKSSLNGRRDSKQKAQRFECRKPVFRRESAALGVELEALAQLGKIDLAKRDALIDCAAAGKTRWGRSNRRTQKSSGPALN